jgi:hypothetical protein
MCLGVPFIALRKLGAVGTPFGRQFLPSVRWRTGQSRAPPDMNSPCPVPDLLPFLTEPTIEPSVPLAHWTLSGATKLPLAQATRRPLITLSTVGAGAVGSPDSPVNYSRSALDEFPRATSSSPSQPGHEIVRCTSG